MESNMTRGLNSPLSPEEQEQEQVIQAIHDAIAVSPAATTHADRPLHSLHLRFALVTTERVPHWEEQAKEAIVAKLRGVQSPPFGIAIPQASMEMKLVPPHVTGFFEGDRLGTEYDCILFRRPAKK